MYLANQEHFKKIDDSEMNNLDVLLEESKKRIEELKEQKGRLVNQYKNLNNELSSEELERRLIEARRSAKELEQNMLVKMNIYKEVEQVSEEKIRDAEKLYNNNRNVYKKTRKICMGIVDSLSEGIEITSKQFFVR